MEPKSVLPHPRKRCLQVLPTVHPHRPHTCWKKQEAPPTIPQCSPLIVDKTFSPETMIFDLQRKCTESYLTAWKAGGNSFVFLSLVTASPSLWYPTIFITHYIYFSLNLSHVIFASLIHTLLGYLLVPKSKGLVKGL